MSNKNMTENNFAASKRSKRENGAVFSEQYVNTIGKKRSFAVEEAHKRLRTNVFFSFADDKRCHVIGITSAMAHEGKTTTAINLAYDIMCAGKKVLLVDADMRLSGISKALQINTSPGLSNILVGNVPGDAVIHRSPICDDLRVIPCGDFPPNPTEMLSSKRMENLIDTLKKGFDYIIIDLPPVSEVADAIIISRLVDGMIVVVRQDYADKKLLDDTMNQLKLNKVNVIGFVMTCTKNGDKKYYKKYNHGYAQGSYAESAASNAQDKR